MTESQAKELLRRGIAAAKAGRQEEARRLLMQVVELDDHSEQGWLWLSGVVEGADDRRVCLENVLAINPDNAHARAGLRWLAKETEAAEAAPEARAEPEAVAGGERCPRCGETIPPSGTECPACGLSLLVACPACGRYVEVDQSVCPACGQVLGDFREGAAYYLSLAHAYIEHHRQDRALEALARAEAEAPDDPEVLRSVAELYEQTGQPDLAVASFERAVGLAPDDGGLHASLGALYRAQGEPEKARAAYEKAARLSPNDPSLLTSLARVRFEAGEAPTEMLKLVQRAVKLDANYAPAHLLLGDLYAALQDRNQAYRQYQTVARLSPSDSEIGLEARRKATDLERSAQPARPEAGPVRTRGGERPGCVSIYAVLLGLNGGLNLLSTVLFGLFLGFGGVNLEQFLPLSSVAPLPFADLMGPVLILSVVILLVMAVLYLALAVGLWNMKNWARITVVILNSVSLLATVAVFASAIVAMRPLSEPVSLQGFPLIVISVVLLWLVFSAYVIFWFLANREMFD